MKEKGLELSIAVRGSEGIDFREGWSTGDMTEAGVEICTVYHADKREKYGGCINRDETKQIRDFLNTCIEKWENETP